MKKFLSLFCLTLQCVYAGPKSEEMEEVVSTSHIRTDGPQAQRLKNLKNAVEEAPEELLLDAIKVLLYNSDSYFKFIKNDDGIFYNDTIGYDEYDIELVEQKFLFEYFFFGPQFRVHCKYSPSCNTFIRAFKILANFKEKIKDSNWFLTNLFHSKNNAKLFKILLEENLKDYYCHPRSHLFSSQFSDITPEPNNQKFFDFFKKNPKEILLKIIDTFEKKCPLFIENNLKEKKLNFEYGSELYQLKYIIKENEDWFLDKNRPNIEENPKTYITIRKYVRKFFDKDESLKLEDLKICSHRDIDPEDFLKRILNYNFSHKDCLLYTSSSEILEKFIYTMNSIFLELFSSLENENNSKTDNMKNLEKIKYLIVVNEVIKFHMNHKNEDCFKGHEKNEDCFKGFNFKWLYIKETAHYLYIEENPKYQLLNF